MNQKVMTWHMLEDVLGWLAVLIVSVIMFFTNLPILDPIASIGITLFILYNVIKNLIQTMRLFLEGVPDHIDLDDLITRMNKIQHVNSTHHTHLWSMDGENHAFSTHIVVPANTTKQEVCDVKEQAKEILTPIKLEHVTIEIEYEDETCSLS